MDILEHSPFGIDNQQTLVMLMERIQHQNQAAFSELYDKTVSKIYGVAFSFLNNAADAEDVVCDTYTKLWQHLAPQFSAEKGSVVGWLSVITRNRCLDVLRKKRNQQKLKEELATQPAADADLETPLSLMNRLEEHHAVRTVIEQLPDNQKTVILLAYFRGLTHQEISQELAIPIGTVKSHSRRAIIALSSLIGEERGLQ